jgi:hypothetical protein
MIETISSLLAHPQTQDLSLDQLTSSSQQGPVTRVQFHEEMDDTLLVSIQDTGCSGGSHYTGIGDSGLYVFNRSGSWWQVGWGMPIVRQWVENKWVVVTYRQTISYGSPFYELFHIEQQDGNWEGRRYLTPEVQSYGSQPDSKNFERASLDVIESSWQITFFSDGPGPVDCHFTTDLQLERSKANHALIYEWNGEEYTLVNEVISEPWVLVRDAQGNSHPLENWQDYCSTAIETIGARHSLTIEDNDD